MKLSDCDPKLRKRITDLLADEDRRKHPATHRRDACSTQSLQLTILGQVSGGKNNMGIGRDGRHYSKSEPWKRWKRAAIRQIEEQLPAHFQTITVPQNLRVEYVAEDKRRRDQPMVFDALFHVLEKAGVVSDDTLLWVKESSRAYDKANPRIVVTLI